MRAIPLTYQSIVPTRRRRRQPALADSVFGMLIFVATEAMFFTALISAFVIIKAGVDLWSPPPGVRLPVIATACNTALLLLSAVLLHQAGGVFSGEKARQPDFLTPHLRTVLAQVGLRDVTAFSVEGTAYGEHALMDARARTDSALGEHFAERPRMELPAAEQQRD